MSITGTVETGLKVRRLERSNNWMWALNIVLLVILSLTVAHLYMLRSGSSLPEWLPAPESAGVLAGALCGLTLLFSLYMIHKQMQISRVRKELLDIQMRAEGVRSRLSGISSLFDASSQIMDQLSTQEILDLVTQRVRGCLEAEQSSLFFWDRQAAELTCKSASGFEAETLLGESIPEDESVAGFVVKSGEALHLNESQLAVHPSFDVTGGMTSVLCVPIAGDEEVIGVINVARADSDNPFTPADLRALSTFGTHVATAIKRQQILGSMDHKAGQLREVNRRLAGLTTSRDRILKALADHLDRPFTMINRCAELMVKGKGPLSPDRRMDLGRILIEQTRAVEQLVGDVYELNRLQMEKGALKLDLCDFNELVSETVFDFELQAAGKGVRIETDFDPRVPSVSLDEKGIRRSVESLLAAAISLCDPRNTIWVSTALNDEKIEFDITSNGSGIDPQLTGKLFEFPDNTPGMGSNAIESMGLRLHLTRQIIQLHGGRVWAEEVGSNGLRFRLQFAAAEPVAEHGSIEAASPNPVVLKLVKNDPDPDQLPERLAS